MERKSYQVERKDEKQEEGPDSTAKKGGQTRLQREHTNKEEDSGSSDNGIERGLVRGQESGPEVSRSVGNGRNGFLDE